MQKRIERFGLTGKFAYRGLFAKSLIFFTFQLTVCPHSTVIEFALFDFFNLALNGYGRHGGGRMAVLAGFKHLASAENGFVLVAPDLFKNLLCHQFEFPFGNGNGITTKLVG